MKKYQSITFANVHVCTRIDGLKKLARKNKAKAGIYIGVTPSGKFHKITLDVMEFVGRNKKSHLNPKISVSCSN